MPTKTEAKIKREYGVRMDLLLSTADIQHEKGLFGNFDHNKQIDFRHRTQTVNYSLIREPSTCPDNSQKMLCNMDFETLHIIVYYSYIYQRSTFIAAYI